MVVLVLSEGTRDDLFSASLPASGGSLAISDLSWLVGVSP